MSRLLLLVAMVLGATYISWGLLLGDRPPTALAVCSFVSAMGSIAARTRAGQAL